MCFRLCSAYTAGERPDIFCQTQKPNTERVKYLDGFLLRIYCGQVALIFRKEGNVEFQDEFEIIFHPHHLYIYIYIYIYVYIYMRIHTWREPMPAQWPRCLRRVNFSIARSLRSRIRISHGIYMFALAFYVCLFLCRLLLATD
jgi:hypothetical protein